MNFVWLLDRIWIWSVRVPSGCSQYKFQCELNAHRVWTHLKTLSGLWIGNSSMFGVGQCYLWKESEWIMCHVHWASVTSVRNLDHSDIMYWRIFMSYTKEKLLKRLCGKLWQTIKVFGELNLFVCITKLLHHETRWEPFITTCESLQDTLLYGVLIESSCNINVSASLFTSTAQLLPIGTGWKRRGFKKSRRVAKANGRIAEGPWVTQKNKHTGSTGKGL